MNALLVVKPGTLRLVLALLVVVHHLTRYFFLGPFAVYVFFILSGYWVSKMWAERYRHARGPLLTFWLSRCWRIYPLYWLSFAGAALLYRSYDAAGLLEAVRGWDFWLPGVFLVGLPLSSYNVVSPAWSLDIEIQFYLLLPLCWYAARRVGAWWLVGVTAALSAVLFAVEPFGLRHTVVFYLPYFFLGVGLYAGGGTWLRRVDPRAGLALGVAVVALHYVVPNLYALSVADRGSDYTQALNLLLPLTMLPYLAHNVRRRSDARDQTWGALSYVVYLVHWLTLQPYAALTAELPFGTRLPYTLAYLVVTLALSYGLLLVFERPVDAARKRWVRRRFEADTPPPGE
ncbi:MAG: acyltransferase [Catalinimonas sp.]